MNKFFKYFGESVIVTAFFLAIAFFIGYQVGGVAGALAALMTTAMLGVLETSLSFDNAVVNAKILQTMSPFWRKMFLTIGMIIAVFGMRIVFPIVIVWLVSSHGLLDVISLTWKNPSEFQKILVDQHIKVAGFGGAFLWMVFSKFFFDSDKDVHWLAWLEKPMRLLGKIEAVWVIFTMAIVFVFSKFVHEPFAFMFSAMMGILVYLVVEGLSSLVKSEEGSIENMAGNTFKAGLMSFIYLEVLDASFSFDGVIGSFAITNNLAIIALGLGIGAMFVRSFTIKLVDDNSLTEFKYLESGAFWAIGCLAAIMFISATGVKIHEVISGTLGLALIGLAFVSSILHKKSSPTT